MENESAIAPAGIPSKALITGLFLLPSLAGLFLLSRQNYLLFHSLIELLSVVVAFTLFSIGWNSRRHAQNNTLLLLASAYLAVGSIDLFHALGYRGMGVFPGFGSAEATQLWIAARFIESLSLFAGAALLARRRPLPAARALAFYILVAALLLLSISPLQIFPVCYVEGEGLTSFKVISEYAISVILAAAGLLFWRHRRKLSPRILYLLLASVAATILGELSFTLYVDVFDFFNCLGHLFKLASFVLIYLALIHGSLKAPQELLFRRLEGELEERRRSEKELEAANKELETFVSTVSHDLRTPLTPIIGFADYLKMSYEEKLEGEGTKAVDAIKSQAERMLETLEDLLALARIGNLERPSESVETSEVVEGVLEELKVQIAESEFEVKTGPLPAVRVAPPHLYQVFENLIGNALRYAGPGGGPIEIHGERGDGGASFSVVDHGPGVPEEERTRIFEAFYRGSTGRDIRGSGVGLASVQKIAKLHGGKILVEETPGGGSTFVVEFPDD